MFRLQEAGLRHRGIAVPHIFAPAAELLIEGLEIVEDEAAVLFLEPGAPLIFRASALHPKLEKLRQVHLDSNLDAVRTANDSIPRHWTMGRARNMPFRDGSFGAILANLTLGDTERDVAIVSEMKRVLKPGGQVLATVLLDGTLEEFFDVTREVCEQQGLVESGAMLADERESQYSAKTLEEAFVDQGFEQVEVGVENRAAPFENGRDFVGDPVVQKVFLSDWMDSLGDSHSRDSALKAIANAIDTYFLGIGFTARMVTGVVSARLGK